MFVDLHIHTTASDGCWTPEQVVAEVEARPIELFAIADHDTIASVPRAEELAREKGLAFLRGVEISTWLDGHLYHVLGYGIDLENVPLAQLLGENERKLQQSSDDTIHKLIAGGHPIDLADYEVYTYPAARGGWKAINFLIDRGLCTGVADYFQNLQTETPASIRSFPHPAEAITAVRGAGGVPILAHPGASLRHASVARDGLAPFLDLGIAGLECYSTYHDEAATRGYVAWCNERGMLITGGSDSHGGFARRALGTPAVTRSDLRLGELEERTT